MSGAVGLRRVVEQPAEGEKRASLLSTLALRKTFSKVGLSLYATHDQEISGDDSNFFPQRTTIGLDQRIIDGLTLNVSHEIQQGENASSANTIAGLTVQPWTGSEYYRLYGYHHTRQRDEISAPRWGRSAGSF